MPVLSSKVLRSTQVFMAVLSPMDVIRRVYIEKYKTHGDTSSANFVDVLFGKFFICKQENSLFQVFS